MEYPSVVHLSILCPSTSFSWSSAATLCFLYWEFIFRFIYFLLCFDTFYRWRCCRLLTAVKTAMPLAEKSVNLLYYCYTSIKTRLVWVEQPDNIKLFWMTFHWKIRDLRISQWHYWGQFLQSFHRKSRLVHVKSLLVYKIFEKKCWVRKTSWLIFGFYHTCFTVYLMNHIKPFKIFHQLSKVF